MKKLAVFLFLFCFAICSGAVVAEGAKHAYKAGDQVYVCGCGKDCDCLTMSTKPGKCSCDKPMVKGTITKVSKGKAIVKTESGDLEFKTSGKYVCACGKGCDCFTISQKPGKCACGKPMKEVKAKK